MIKKLQKEFITISIAAVVSVMVLLCVIVNVANFVSVNSKLNNTIEMISSNKGMMPDFNPPEKPKDDKGEKPDSRRFDNQFNEETPFSTRFFVLYYNGDGTLIRSDLDKIAAVTNSDTRKYLDIALEKGEGYGFTDGYKYKVTIQEDGSYSAIFLDDYREMSSAKTILFLSIAATVICSVLICVLIVLFSKRAVKPVIESNKKQKQFITDASHELKTPITVISTSLSVLEMEVGKQKWIDKSKEQTEKLTELVNSLVTLSKTDEETPLNIREFNISDAVKETADSFSDFSEQNGHRIETNIAPSIMYNGDEYSVRQLCSILIDNAVKYASEGTPIRFTLEKDKKGVVITSENECENVNTDELDKLFDRFYRADKSRSSQTGGFGIGLSIARSICQAHKGEIKAVCDNGRTVKFIAKLR
ncbi:MAG: HAMP domain-containing histidine kinase [Clostridiales bacterium]|nr:HAMP domain-containing histidine kinase [Clostridiales bacterium]